MTNKSPKSAVTALLLCIFLGTLGIHRFYVGKIGTGLLMLITGGGFGIWVIIDIVMIACGDFKDKEGRNLEFTRTPGTFKKVMIVLASVVGGILIFVCIIIMLAFYITRGLTEPIDEQLAALRSGNMTVAYSYTSKEFQNVTSIDAFKKFIDRYPALKNNKSASFPEREFENSEGKVIGILKSNDGAVTPIEYRLVKEDGKWKILGLQMRPVAAGIEASQSNNKATPFTLSNVFDDPRNKFSIKYPADWVYEQPNKDKIIFNGKKGTASFDSVVNIQSLPSKKSGGIYKNTKELMDDLKKQISTQTSKIEVLGEGPINLMQDGKKLEVRTFVFNYTFKDKEFKQMLFVVPRKDGKAFYTWTFNSTKEQYEKDLPIAKAMFESWSIH